MKITRSLLLTGAMAMIIMLFTGVQAQGPGPEHPDAKWEVRKEYDEQGNLIYYDSSYIKTWKHFDFPGNGGMSAFKDLDSLFGEFFHSPGDMFDFHPFSEFPDSAFMDPFFPDSLFPDAFKPFEDFFPPSFHGPGVFFDRHKEWMEKLQEEFTFPDDSLFQPYPKWQQLPRQQKKPPRVIEI
jgi:hypothetical protein